MKRLKMIAVAFALIASGCPRLGGAQDADLSGAFEQAKADVHSYKTITSAPPTPARLMPIVIFHTNDIHGHVAPTPANPKTGAPASGGAASLATLLNGESRPHLWIDSGDWFQGAAEGTLTRGDAVIDVFNALGMTATVLGNHDYDYGEDNVKRLAGKATFPILGANVSSTLTGQTPGYITPYMIKDVDGVKIGIFGLLTHDMPQLVSAQLTPNLDFGAESGIAAGLVQKLRAQGATVVIAATHLGLQEDIDLAKHVSGIDVILGGHSHTDMKTPLTVSAPGYSTLIIQNQGMLLSVDELDLSVDAATGHLAHIDERPVALDPSQYAPDPGTVKLVGRYQAEVDAQMSQSIGSAGVALMRRSDGESDIGDWITDVYRSYGRTDIGIMNTFGIRADVPQGPLAKRNILEVMPFEDYLDKIEIQGSELRKLIQNGFGDSVLLQYSGLTIVYDPSQPAGQRLVSVGVNGQALDDAATYTATTREYVLTVDKSFKNIQYRVVERLPMLVRDLLIEQVRRHSPLVAPTGGRIRTK